MTANAVSLTGNQLALLALPWFVLQTTGSPARVGLAGAVEAIGIIGSSFFGGALVDRIGFRRSSMLADVASGIAIALIPLLDRLVGLSFWQLLLLIFAVANFNAPGSTARSGILPDLAEVARLRLEQAASFDQGIKNFASLGGPLLAGLLIATISARNVLWADAASFALSAGVVGLLVPASSLGPGRTEIRYLAALLEGVTFIRSDRVILTLGSIGAYVNSVGAALMAVVLPVLAQRVFDSSVALGVLIAADGGGALLGTIVFGFVGYRWRRRRALFIAFLVSFFALATLVATPGLVLSMIAMIIDGAAFGIIGPLIFTIYQERLPAGLRGRVLGGITAFQRVAAPLGVVLAGAGIQVFGLTNALVTVAALSLVMPLMIATAPALRSIERSPESNPRDVTPSQAG